jgi:hypothetical protein
MLLQILIVVVGISVGSVLYVVLQQCCLFHICGHRSPGKETSEYENLESDTVEDEDEKRENAEIESFELEEKRIVEEVERQVRGVKGSIYLNITFVFLEAEIHIFNW